MIIVRIIKIFIIHFEFFPFSTSHRTYKNSGKGIAVKPTTLKNLINEQPQLLLFIRS